jgi:hypothetical protein
VRRFYPASPCLAVGYSGDTGRFEVRVDQRVLRCRVMDQRCAGCQRLVERDDRRLGSDLDRDLFGEIFGLSGRVGNYCGDRLANIVDTLVGEDRLRYRDIIGAIKLRTGSIISQRLGSKARRACRRRPRPSGGYSQQTSVKGSPPAEPAPRGIW